MSNTNKTSEVKIYRLHCEVRFNNGSMHILYSEVHAVSEQNAIDFFDAQIEDNLTEYIDDWDTPEVTSIEEYMAGKS